MNAFTAMLMGVIPLTLFAWTGSHIRGGIDKKQDAERWLLFLLGLVTLLLAGMLIPILFSANQTPVTFFLILPSLWGSQAALFLVFFSGDRTWPHSHLTWALSVFILGLLIWIGIVGEPFTVPLILIGSLLIALIWQAWNWVKRWSVTAYAILVLLLLLALWRTDTARPLFENPAWLSSAVQTVLALVPGAAVIVAARIVDAGIGDEKSFDPRRFGLALISVLLILFLVAYPDNAGQHLGCRHGWVEGDIPGGNDLPRCDSFGAHPFLEVVWHAQAGGHLLRSTCASDDDQRRTPWHPRPEWSVGNVARAGHRIPGRKDQPRHPKILR